MIALTGGQRLIFACVGLIATVLFFVEFWYHYIKEPPLGRDTRRLRKELERHPSDFEEN